MMHLVTGPCQRHSTGFHRWAGYSCSVCQPFCVTCPCWKLELRAGGGGSFWTPPCNSPQITSLLYSLLMMSLSSWPVFTSGHMLYFCKKCVSFQTVACVHCPVASAEEDNDSPSCLVKVLALPAACWLQGSIRKHIFWVLEIMYHVWHFILLWSLRWLIPLVHFVRV